MFSDESRFCFHKNDGRIRVWRRRGERNARACVVPRTAFGGGSIMVWGAITAQGKSQLIIAAGNLTGQRYIDEILTPVAIPYIGGMGQDAVFIEHELWTLVYVNVT